MDAGSFNLGALDAQYAQLFSEALREGAITEEDRARLDHAARTVGLDRARVALLEAALRDGSGPGAERVGRDTLVDLEDPSAFCPSSGHISVAVEAASGRTRAVSVTFESHQEEAPPIDTRNAPNRAKALAERELLHHRYEPCERNKNLDGQWCTAAVLVRRREATSDEERFYQAHRSATLARPTTTLTLAGWQRLFHREADRLTSDIFAVIAPAALLCRIAAMRADGSLVRLDATQRQDPARTSVIEVRAIAWSAATLGLQAPPIYVTPEVDTGLEIVTQMPPASRIGARMLSGHSAVALAFHTARHVTWFRADHFVCTIVPTLADLVDLFVAALAIGAPELRLPESVRKRPRRIAEAIAPVLESSQVGRLSELVQRFLAQGHQVNLQAWARGARYTAQRAGLLLAGDLEIACGIVQGEPDGQERVRDLETFFASDAATDLRRQLGIALVSA